MLTSSTTMMMMMMMMLFVHSLTHSLAVAIRSEQRLGRPSASIRPSNIQPGPGENDDRRATAAAAAAVPPQLAEDNNKQCTDGTNRTGRPTRPTRPSVKCSALRPRSCRDLRPTVVTKFGPTQRLKRRPSVRVRPSSPCDSVARSISIRAGSSIRSFVRPFVRWGSPFFSTRSLASPPPPPTPPPTPPPPSVSAFPVFVETRDLERLRLGQCHAAPACFIGQCNAQQRLMV